MSEIVVSTLVNRNSAHSLLPEVGSPLVAGSPKVSSRFDFRFDGSRR